MLAFLDGAEAAAASRADLEERLQADARELFRRLYQDHLDLRAQREAWITVHGADGVSRTRVEIEHTRELITVFGQVPLARSPTAGAGSRTCIPATPC